MNLAVQASLRDVDFSPLADAQMVHLDHMVILVWDFREISELIFRTDRQPYATPSQRIRAPLSPCHTCTHRRLFSSESHSEWDEIESPSSLSFPCRTKNVKHGAREMTQR